MNRYEKLFLGVVLCLSFVACLFIFEKHRTDRHIDDNRTKIELKKVQVNDSIIQYIELLEASIDVSTQNRISAELAMQILRAADRNDIPRDVAVGLVREESSFRPDAVSSAGAIGLTQLMPATARWINPDGDPFDVEDNLEMGFSYLRSLIDKYGDKHTALVAYNVGPTRVDNYGVMPYTQSIQYANRVTGRM
jgi:soluble lytic murein transglycosylase-like protein